MTMAGRALLQDVIRNDVLTVEAEVDGRPVVIRYRPASALKSSRKPRPEEGLPVLDWLNICSETIVSIVVDGKPLALGKAVVTTKTLALMLSAFPLIAAHAEKWMEAGVEPGGELAQRAERRATSRAKKGRR
jgi:hypothetical protein